MFDYIGLGLRWMGAWLYYVCLICMIGAVLGLVSHLLWGVVFYESPDYGHLAALGVLHGLNYGGVWAGGAAIVLCVIRARKNYLEQQATLGLKRNENI